MHSKDERKFKFAGIKKITLPLSEDELTPEKIKKFFPDAVSAHKANAEKIKYYKNYVDGFFQPIDNKTRKFENSVDHNNKIKQNHAYSIVTFKEGFLLGDKREFAQKSDSNSDDLIYLERYLSDVAFYSKDLEVKHNIYSTGIGTSFVSVRPDLVADDNGVYRFKVKKEGYDVDNDSPFIYECVDSQYNAVVYTSKIGKRGLGDLFCFNISTEYDKDGNEKTVYTVYTREYTIRLNDEFEFMDSPISTPIDLKMLPMVEHSINSSRIGAVEIIEGMLNGVNTLVSNCVDNVVDTVNQILVFLGCDAKEIKLEDILESGMICIPPSNGTVNPALDKITLDMRYSDVNVLMQEILTRCYDIAGVPLSNTTSGNGNNQAAYVGGGWTNAMTIIKRDVRALEESDRELLKKMLLICKLNPDNKVNEISANQIEIKYNVKITDNVLSYTQALQNLVDSNVPFEHILKAIPLWGDTKTVAKDWNENVKRLKEEQENQNRENEVSGSPTVEQEPNMDNP